MTGYIYAARIGETIKVGFSCRPGVRVGILKSQHKCWVDLIGVVDASPRDESSFHRRNRRYAVGSELYPADAPPIVDLISRLHSRADMDKDARPRRPRRWFPPFAGILPEQASENAA